MLFLKPSFETHLKIPFVFCPIQAGFPSPADDYGHKKIDLNAHLIKHPSSTFFARIQGDSMIEKGILPGDLAIIDKSLEPKNGSIVIAILNKEFTVKEFRQDENKKIYLYPANKNYPKIEIKLEDDFEIWGVVTNVIHSCV